MKLGQRLRRAREHAQLTQVQLEGRSGVSQKTISKIERGDQDASTQVAQLARACGVDTEWLATGEGEMLANKARQPQAVYGLSSEALEIARVWSKLSPERRKWFRGLMSLEALVAAHYPWLLFDDSPTEETFDEYEKRVKRRLGVK